MPHFERKYLGGNKLINYWVNLHKISCYDKRKFKQWWSTIPQISTKWTTTLSLWIQYNNMTYGIGNPSTGLGHA
jgi:hypothetical protein